MSADPQTTVGTSVEPPFNAARRFSMREYGVLLVFVALFIALSIASPTFIQPANLANLLDQASTWGIVACGATLTIVSGIFDLSIGSVFAVSGIVAVLVATQMGTLAGFVAAVIVGAAMGTVNGLVVTLARVNSFIATLATSFLFGGLAIVISQGKIVTISHMSFLVMNDTPIFDITGASWLFIGVALVTGLVLALTGYGRSLYAIGGNKEAARLSGIRTIRDQILVLTISGACAGTAAIIGASQTGSASASMGGSTLTLTAIAATVIGGTSILGGEGSIGRAMIGVFILVLISNGFNLLGINANYQEIVQGFLILVAVGLDQAFRWRSTA